MQASIDRRLFPRKYDSAQVLTALSTTLRDEVDLSRLTEQLESAVSEVLQPAAATGIGVFLAAHTIRLSRLPF